MEKTTKHDAISSNAMHSTSQKHSTNYAMRIFYALAIVFVVAGHSSLYYPSGFNLGYNLFPVYAFHMPMFIFAAGYFYNPKHEKHPVKFVLGKVRRLLVPMFAIHAFTGWFATFLASQGFTAYDDVELTLHNVFVEPFLHDNMHMFAFDLAMWFLIPMFIAQCVYMAFHALVVHGSGRLRLTLDTILGAACLAAGICVIDMFGGGEAQKMIAESDMLRIYQSLFFLAFMSIGYYYRTYLEEYFDKIPDAVALTALLLFQLVLMFIYGTDLTMVVCWLGFPAGAWGTIAMGMSGTLFWLRVSKILAPRLKGSWLANEIGKNTFSIMAFHFIGFFVLNLILFGLKQATGGAHFAAFAEDVFFDGGIYYKYVPENMTVTPGASDAWGLLYVMFGVGVPLLLHKMWELAYSLVKKVLSMARPSLLGHGEGKVPEKESADKDKDAIAPAADSRLASNPKSDAPRHRDAPKPHKRVSVPDSSQTGNYRMNTGQFDACQGQEDTEGRDYRLRRKGDKPKKKAPSPRKGRASYRLRQHTTDAVGKGIPVAISERLHDAQKHDEARADSLANSVSSMQASQRKEPGHGGASKRVTQAGNSRTRRAPSTARQGQQGQTAAGTRITDAHAEGQSPQCARHKDKTQK